MNIEWNKVTWYSKIVAIVLYVGTFALAFYLGYAYAHVERTVPKAAEANTLSL